MADENLALIVGAYQTIVTPYTFVGGGMEQVLEQNPRRWYVQFQLINGAGAWRLSPGPLEDTTSPGNIDASDSREYKFRDCPSVVTGEWFAKLIAGAVLQITECVYLR